MNRITFWLLIALATFAFGIITTLFWSEFNYSKVQETKASSSFSLSNKDWDSTEKPIISYCELASNSERYNGKIMRVRARLVAGKHGLLLLDSNCLENTEQAAVFYSSQNKDEIEKRLGRGFDVDFNIVAVGSLKKVVPSNRSDSKMDTAKLQVEIEKIEQAVKFR